MSYGDLSPEAQEIVRAEDRVLSDVVEALSAQHERALQRLSVESERARELTSALVAAKRVEDKAMMASDEAVSHGLRDKITGDIKVLERLIKQPYFARMILSEEGGQEPKTLEYRLGFAENAECRIIDWRKAPIAKLYYEYKEGEEYAEQILGKERSGTVALRNQVEIEKSRLKRVVCRLGEFERRADSWVARMRGHAVRTARAENAAGTAQTHNLPQIAALLTPEQFSLVAESKEQALLIQGIAGSGKTTVALHRLAFLMGSPSDSATGFSPPRPEFSLVIVLSPTLKEYISTTLPSLGVHGVAVNTVEEFMLRLLREVYPQFVAGSPQEAPALKDPQTQEPTSHERVKRSMALLRGLEEDVQRIAAEARQTTPLPELLLRTLKDARRIVALDETKLINEALVREVYERTALTFRAGACTAADIPLLVRIAQLQQGALIPIGGKRERLDHLVVDEVQDFSPPELACLIESVQHPHGITIVGDTAQQIRDTTFPGWDKLRRFWRFKEHMAQFVTLNLSYRSTVEIVKLAEYIRGEGAGTSQAAEGRHGRVPLWCKCMSESHGLKTAIQWLLKACELYPGCLHAVVTRSKSDAQYVYRLLQPSFGPVLRLGDDYSFTFFEGIVVCAAEQVKGIEFTNVLVWNPNRKDFPADAYHRNVLYTVLTRASENVALVSWQRASELLPPFSSTLVRGVDMTEPEDESSTAR